MELKYISNNPLIKKEYKSSSITFIEGSTLDVFKAVRKKILKNNKLITHPLTGNIPPDVIPYKSVVITDSDCIDQDSLHIIDKSIIYTIRLAQNGEKHNWKDINLRDFQLLDLDYVKKALKNIYIT